MFAALGTKVTVLEMLPQVLPMVDADLVSGLHQAPRRPRRRDPHQRQGHRGREGQGRRPAGAVLRGRRGRRRRRRPGPARGRPLAVHGRARRGGGRREARARRVVVDEHLRTDADGRLGDRRCDRRHHARARRVVRGRLRGREHRRARESYCPTTTRRPNCIYTDPEIAHVGLGEKEAKDKGLDIKVGRFPFVASGRALTLGQTRGLREGHRRRGLGQAARRAHHRAARDRPDRRGDARDPERADHGAARPDDPRPPDAAGIADGSRAGGAGSGHPYRRTGSTVQSPSGACVATSPQSGEDCSRETPAS